MYIKDGIVYGGEPEEPFSVSAVKPLPNMEMLITFSNGETRLFDATVLDGEVFEPLKSEDIFENATIDHGMVTWANGEIDCAPEYMYRNSYEYRDVSSLF